MWTMRGLVFIVVAVLAFAVLVLVPPEVHRVVAGLAIALTAGFAGLLLVVTSDLRREYDMVEQRCADWNTQNIKTCGKVLARVANLQEAMERLAQLHDKLEGEVSAVAQRIAHLESPIPPAKTVARKKAESRKRKAKNRKR